MTNDFSISKPESWTEMAHRNIQKSQAERSKARQLRTDAEALVNRVAQEMWDAWNGSNNALARRCNELLETKSKLQHHLHKVRSHLIWNHIHLLEGRVGGALYYMW